MEKEKVQSNIVDWKVLKRLIGFTHPFRYIFYFILFLTVALSVVGPIRPMLIQRAIDENVAVGDYEGLTERIILLIILLIFQTLVQFLHTYYAGLLGQNIIKNIRIRLYSHIQKLKLQFFDKTPVGRLVTRNISDVETLAEVFSTSIAGIAADVLQLFVILGFMIYIDWVLTLVSLSLLPFILLATYIFKEKVKVAFNEVRTAVSNLNSFVQEHITGMSIVQIFNSEARELKKFKAINREHRKANINSVRYYAIYFPVAEVIQAASIGLIVWYGGGQLIQSSIQFGVMIAFILYLQMFFRPMRMIADRFNTLQMGIVSSNRIISLLDNVEQIPNNGTYQPDTIHGKVSFNQVWFAYNEEEWVLKDISLEVKQGDTLALVGATGSGKTSIINLLNRFYEIKKGQILVDGKDVRTYDIWSLRKHIAMVLQDVFLFSDTIFNNITLRNPQITLTEVMHASKMVGALNFIEKLPGGFNYNVMERGATLSVGQRQLISFVRALVFNPKIIVLDEATSSIDTENEKLIQTAIQKLMQGRTSIVIAHRLSTIQHANKIIVLDKGEIVEKGTHHELLAHNGHYTQLYQMQYKKK